jgi:mycofactocin system glycosyltransferase
VAFVDANCEPEPGWLDTLLPHFADPQVAAVAPRILSTRGEGPLAAYEAVASPLDLGEREAIVRPRSPVAYVPTAALIVRRSALEALGGFDEGLTVGEDVDFVWRLVAAGWTVRYEPRAVVRHPARPSWRAWLGQRYRYGTSAAALARRHGWAVAPAVVSPWTAGAWTMVALGQPLLGAAVAGSSTVALTSTVPPSEALRLAGLGHLRGGLALARALRRAWPPAAVVLALASRRSRPALAAAALVPGALEWLQRRPRLDPVRYLGLHLADDLAYATGVWAGCARERSPRALLPDLRSARSGAGAPN